MLLRRLLNVFVNKVDPDQAALVLRLAYGDMKYLIIYARAVAFKRFCKQSKSGSGGSRESCLTRVYSLCKQSRSRSSSSLESCLNRVYSVCLWGYEISDHT